MQVEPQTNAAGALEVPQYMRDLTAMIQREEPELWRTFSGKSQLAELSESTQLELLKNTEKSSLLTFLTN